LRPFRASYTPSGPVIRSTSISWSNKVPLGDAWHSVRAGGRLSLEQKVWLRLAAVQACTMASQAVDLMFTAGGATSVYASAGFERCLQDIRTAARHVTVHSNIFGLAGQALLGLDVSKTQLSIDDRGDSQVIRSE